MAERTCGRTLGLLAFLFVALGCRSQPAQPLKLGPTASVPSSPHETGTWHLHPIKKGRPSASIALSDKERLEVDHGGSRWITRPGRPPRVSPFSAPEPLVGVVQIGARFGAVGQSGVVYRFSKPLGPFEEVTSPPETYVKTAVSGKALFSINHEGKLFRSIDLGEHFSTIKNNSFFVDVASESGGDIYAVAVPEQWFRSTDLGKTFAPLNVPSLAPMGIERSEGGALVVRGLFSSVSPSKHGWEIAKPEAEAVSAVELPPFARISQVVGHQAVFDENGYLGLRTNGASGFRVEFGSIDRQLDVTDWPSPPGCASFRIFGSSKSPVLLCFEDSSEVSPRLSIYRWAPEQRKWRPFSRVLRGAPKELRLVVDSHGGVALTGACAPHNTDAGCDPYGIVAFGQAEEDEPQLRFFQSPGESEILDFAFDPHDQLWFIAQRPKDNHLLLVGPMVAGTVPQLVDLTYLDPMLAPDQHHRAQLLLGDSGVLTVLIERFGVFSLAQLDQQGRLLASNRAPLGAKVVHGTGRHLAAVDASKNVYWESTTGGITWQKQAVPTRLCDTKNCAVELRCAASGCLVGEELVRFGYTGPSVDPVTSPRFWGADEAPSHAQEEVRCIMSEGTFKSLPRAWSPPSAHDVLLGETLWYSIVGDEESSRAEVVFVAPRSTVIDRRVLFPPRLSSQSYMLKYFPQVEGAALVRHQVDPGTRELSGPVEIAWDNRIESTTEQVTIGPGTPGPGAQLQLGQALEVSMLSVAGKGLFLQLGPDGEFSPYYLPGGGAPAAPFSEPKFPDLSQESRRSSLFEQLVRGARTEGVVAHGERNGLFLLANNRVVVRGMMEAGQLKFVPYLMGGLSSAVTESGYSVRIAYRGRDVGFLSLRLDDRGQAQNGWFVELGKERAFERPLEVALPKHLPERPQVCEEAVRERTPRVIIADEPGRRVAIAGLGKDPVELEIGEAVLFGSPELPCLGAWTAGDEPAALGNDDEVYQAVVVPEAQATSWIFRYRGGSGGTEVAVQPMSCSFE